VKVENCRSLLHAVVPVHGGSGVSEKAWYIVGIEWLGGVTALPSVWKPQCLSALLILHLDANGVDGDRMRRFRR